MRLTHRALILPSLVLPHVIGFPRLFDTKDPRSLTTNTNSQLDCPHKTAQQGKHKKKRQASFDPTTQYVSTTGSHAFVAPNLAGGDQRGPCPGLNALANHG